MNGDNKDLATMVAVTQEKMGSLNDKVNSMHSRQTKMEENIEKVMKEVLTEMKDLKKNVDKELDIIMEYINYEKGKSVTNTWIIRGFVSVGFTIIGGLVVHYLKR